MHHSEQDRPAPHSVATHYQNDRDALQTNADRSDSRQSEGHIVPSERSCRQPQRGKPCHHARQSQNNPMISIAPRPWHGPQPHAKRLVSDLPHMGERSRQDTPCRGILLHTLGLLWETEIPLPGMAGLVDLCHIGDGIVPRPSLIDDKIVPGVVYCSTGRARSILRSREVRESTGVCLPTGYGSLLCAVLEKNGFSTILRDFYVCELRPFQIDTNRFLYRNRKWCWYINGINPVKCGRRHAFGLLLEVRLVVYQRVSRIDIGNVLSSVVKLPKNSIFHKKFDFFGFCSP